MQLDKAAAYHCSALQGQKRSPNTLLALTAEQANAFRQLLLLHGVPSNAVEVVEVN